jgi:hypothetical protein
METERIKISDLEDDRAYLSKHLGIIRGEVLKLYLDSDEDKYIEITPLAKLGELDIEYIPKSKTEHPFAKYRNK